MSQILSYRVELQRPEAHLFKVTLAVDAPDPEGLRVTLPAWIPGSYMIRDFARNIVRFRAFAGGRALRVSSVDKQTWVLEPTEEPVELVYEVYAWDLSVRGAHLDRTHGYFNGTSLFLRVVGQESRPHEVVLSAPAPDRVEGDWRVATTLPATEVDERGFGRYRTENYESLIDHPVEMGGFQTLDFEVEGVPHRMAVSGRALFDKKRLADDLQRICSAQAALFGELPVDRYLFLVQATADGYGGLEHRDSSSLMCSRRHLPSPRLAPEETDRHYREFLGLCSHEYFHLWNVKRIRPERFMALDLEAEAHTRLLWAFEGITSYYDDLMVLRAGCVRPEEYLETLAGTVTRVMRTPGRRLQSVAESSFHAWTRFYRQDENAPNALVSYYAKGALVALGLDVELRLASSDKVGLDDLMRRLWQEHGCCGRGVPEEGIQALAEGLVGRSLAPFFEDYVEGTVELPLGRWFQALGIGFRLRPARSDEDNGGAGTPELPRHPRLVLGVRTRKQGDFVALQHLYDGGAAQAAGLAAGDRLVALEGIQVTADNLDDLLQRHAHQESVEVMAFRRDELMRFEVRPQPAPADTCDLWLLSESELAPDQLARRRAWLGQ